MAATIAVSCQAAWLSWSWSYPFRPWVRRRNWKWPRPDCLRTDEKWSNMKQHLTVIYGDLHSCLCLQQKRSNCKRTRPLAAAFCQASALPQQEIRQFRVTQSWQKCTSDLVDSRKWCTCVGKWLNPEAARITSSDFRNPRNNRLINFQAWSLCLSPQAAWREIAGSSAKQLQNGSLRQKWGSTWNPKAIRVQVPPFSNQHKLNELRNGEDAQHRGYKAGTMLFHLGLSAHPSGHLVSSKHTPWYVVILETGVKQWNFQRPTAIANTQKTSKSTQAIRNSKTNSKEII